MNYDKKLEELALELFYIDAVKFGDFMTKSGAKTPIYFDLRVIVSYPKIMELITNLLYECSLKNNNSDHLCGVPYTALPIATLLSVLTNKSMLMRRKEAKGYGTKKMIEGHYKAGQSCLIIEDVVTSGSSVLETANDLRKEGLLVEEAVIILDREQGGKENLKANSINIRSLFTMSKLIDILVSNGKIDQNIASKVNEYLKTTVIPNPNNTEEIRRISLPYEKRAEIASNSVAKQLFNIMATKRTNLCLSVDLTNTRQILDLVEKLGEHVCLVKTHVDIIEDFNDSFIQQLKQSAARHNFLILEDRKFADIGNTVSLQYSHGIYKIAEWADCVTAHSLPGEGVLQALSESTNALRRGVFLLAEMSSKGTLITPDYKESTIKMAEKYPELITGFVCQNKDTFKDPGQIQLTPGVQLDSCGDNLGQIYNTPEKIIFEKGADIAVVGRGIVAAKNPEAQAEIYKDVLWKYYLQRINKA